MINSCRFQTSLCYFSHHISIKRFWYFFVFVWIKLNERKNETHTHARILIKKQIKKEEMNLEITKKNWISMWQNEPMTDLVGNVNVNPLNGQSPYVTLCCSTHTSRTYFSLHSLSISYDVQWIKNQSKISCPYMQFYSNNNVDDDDKKQLKYLFGWLCVRFIVRANKC